MALSFSNRTPMPFSPRNGVGALRDSAGDLTPRQTSYDRSPTDVALYIKNNPSLGIKFLMKGKKGRKGCQMTPRSSASQTKSSKPTILAKCSLQSSKGGNR